MNLEERINAFSKLGERLADLTQIQLEDLSLNAQNQNSWFTKTNVSFAIHGITKFLTRPVLEKWANTYTLPNQPKRIGVVMSGNIPLVGFHDLLCVLISGHNILIKSSSSDSFLINYIIEELIVIESSFSDKIQQVDKLEKMDAVIATGSDNTARYFEYYFSKYPHIIRKNRTSIAVLDGNESKGQLSTLGIDIFTYYGLGCRNVSKVFVPEDYDFTPFFESIEGFSDIKNHHKYANNYDYNKSIYLVNGDKHLDNGFLLLKETTELVSPISVLYYEKYQDSDELANLLSSQAEKVQCIVSSNQWWHESIDFGNAQTPEITDYADRVDTMEFLCSL